MSADCSSAFGGGFFDKFREGRHDTGILLFRTDGDSHAVFQPRIAEELHDDAALLEPIIEGLFEQDGIADKDKVCVRWKWSEAGEPYEALVEHLFVCAHLQGDCAVVLGRIECGECNFLGKLIEAEIPCAERDKLIQILP